MILRTEEPITLVKVMDKSFLNKDNERINFATARLVDNEYNVIDLGVDKEAFDVLKNLTNVQGHAMFQLTSYQNKIKTKLLAFKEE